MLKWPALRADIDALPIFEHHLAHASQNPGVAQPGGHDFHWPDKFLGHGRLMEEDCKERSVLTTCETSLRSFGYRNRLFDYCGLLLALQYAY